MDTNVKIALDIFEKIKVCFPNLVMNIDTNPEQVELDMDIPKQDGLEFNIYLNLQNSDELHLNAGDYFWLEWFPCNKDEVAKAYFEAVCGLLSGSYRIVEYYSGKKAVKAKLQSENKRTWTDVGCWSRVSLSISFRTNKKILHNQAKNKALID